MNFPVLFRAFGTVMAFRAAAKYFSMIGGDILLLWFLIGRVR